MAPRFDSTSAPTTGPNCEMCVTGYWHLPERNEQAFFSYTPAFQLGDTTRFTNEYVDYAKAALSK